MMRPYHAWIAALIGLAIVPCLRSASNKGQQTSTPTNPALKCDGPLPDSYYPTVVEKIEPPDPEWRHATIRISVNSVTQLDLWTDGNQFKLWTDTVAPANIGKFLSELSSACRLPSDPADAAALLQVRWESVSLSPMQFADIHRRLTAALAAYVGAAQSKYQVLIRTKDLGVYVDASVFPVRYYTSFQEIDTSVWDDPQQGANREMLDWIHELQILGQKSFHRPIWPNANFVR